MPSPVKNVLRVLAAVAALVAGGVHVKLYLDGYDDADGGVGIQFLLNALGALAIAIGLLAPIVSDRLPSWIPTWASSGGIVWAAISLVAFVLARTDLGWFGFEDQATTFSDSTDAKLAVIPEVIVLAAATLLRGFTLLGSNED